MESQKQNADLRRELSAFDAICIVVGTIIGSAIFLIPFTIAGLVASPLFIFLIWIGGGVLSLFGALSLAELGSMFPGAGGLYVYLREAYGSLPAFLYGWGLLAMIHSGSIAALALGFSVYFGHLFGLGPGLRNAVAVACILLLTVVNCFGIHTGKVIQNLLTLVKVAGALGVIVVLFGHGIGMGLLRTALYAHASRPSWGSTLAALVAVLWAYEGWHVVSFAGGEMRRPGTDLPRSLGFGTLIILGLYVLANTSYYTVLTPAEIGSNPAVAAVAMEKSFGLGAGQFIAVLILISVIGSMNGMVMTGPRAYYAMSQDRMFFEVFGRLSKESRSPVFGLLLQGAWASILTCSGTYQQLFTDVIFTAWLFYGMTVAGVVVLRWRAPELKRLYRVPLFPLIPVVFCFAALAISVSAIAESPLRSLAGLGLILTGIPFFLFFLRRSHARSAGQDTVRSSSVVERAQ